MPPGLWDGANLKRTLRARNPCDVRDRMFPRAGLQKGHSRRSRIMLG
jgi:hypothetical protein